MADPIYPAQTGAHLTLNDGDAQDHDAQDHEAWIAEQRKATRLPTLVMAGCAGLFILMLATILIAFGIKTMNSKPAVVPVAAAIPAPTAPLSKDAQIAALQSQIASLQGQLAAHGVTAGTAAAPAYAPDPAAVAQLSARLDRVEANQRTLAHAAMAVGAAQALARAAEAGAPFPAELALAQSAGVDAHTLEPIRPFADHGVPSEIMLATQFPRIAAMANVAAKAAGGGKGVAAGLSHTLGSFISVRRTDNDSGLGVEATLARAQNHLDAGNFAGAVAALNALPAPAQTAIKTWLDQARARVALDAATRQIGETALGAMGNAGSPAGGSGL